MSPNSRSSVPANSTETSATSSDGVAMTEISSTAGNVAGFDRAR
jgi:hypothetical protein